MIDSYTALQDLLFSPERVPLAMAAILLTGIAGMITGPFAGNANPLFWVLVDKTIGVAGGRLDRVQRKAGDLMFRGLVLTMVAVVVFYIIGGELEVLTRRFPFGGASEIILLSFVLTSGTVWFALLQLFFAMKEKKISKNAYYTIARTTRTDLSGSDPYTITRIGMAMAARSMDKGIVAPVLWYLIAGLPGAYIYAGLAVLGWRFGKDGFTKGFGRVPLVLEQLMGFIPNGLAGVLMAGAGLLTPTGGMTRAFAGLMRKEGKTPYTEGGVPVTAMANSLNVALGGPAADVDGSALKRSWVGPEGATAQLDAGHLQRALYISLMAHLLFLAGLGASLLFAPN